MCKDDWTHCRVSTGSEVKIQKSASEDSDCVAHLKMQQTKKVKEELMYEDVFFLSKATVCIFCINTKEITTLFLKKTHNRIGTAKR